MNASWYTRNQTLRDTYGIKSVDEVYQLASDRFAKSLSCHPNIEARKLILEPFIPVRLLRPRYTEQLDRCMAPLRQQQLTPQREVAEERLPTLLQLEEDEQEAERRAAMLAEWEQRRAMGPPKRFDECTINMLRRKLKAGTITRENLMLLIDNQPPQIQWLILPELQHEHLQRQHQELIRTAEPAPGAIIQSAIDTDELQLERSLDMLEQALGQEMDEALIIAGNNIQIEMQQRLADNESVQLNTNELQMQHGQRLCGSSTNNTNATNTNNVNNDNDSDFDNDEFELFLSTYLQKKAELNPSLVHSVQPGPLSMRRQNNLYPSLVYIVQPGPLSLRRQNDLHPSLQPETEPGPLSPRWHNYVHPTMQQQLQPDSLPERRQNNTNSEQLPLDLPGLIVERLVDRCPTTQQLMEPGPPEKLEMQLVPVRGQPGSSRPPSMTEH
nr:uncharacterized protein LOC116650138 [Drosophila virilis]